MGLKTFCCLFGAILSIFLLISFIFYYIPLPITNFLRITFIKNYFCSKAQNTIRVFITLYFISFYFFNVHKISHLLVNQQLDFETFLIFMYFNAKSLVLLYFLSLIIVFIPDFICKFLHIADIKEMLNKPLAYRIKIDIVHTWVFMWWFMFLFSSLF